MKGWPPLWHRNFEENQGQKGGAVHEVCVAAGADRRRGGRCWAGTEWLWIKASVKQDAVVSRECGEMCVAGGVMTVCMCVSVWHSGRSVCTVAMATAVSRGHGSRG